MRTLRSLIVIAIATALTSCATRPKTYAPPDATQVTATTKRLSDAVTKASETATRAERHVKQAQKANDQVAAESATVVNLVNELAKLVPPELAPKVDELKGAVDRQQVATGELTLHLSGAQSEHEQLTKDNLESWAAKIALQVAQARYQADAKQIAQHATDERNARIAAEKQLSREKWARLFWKIGGGFLVLGIIALFILWLAGKWSIKGARAWFKI